jgi:serine/threonine-protein kinase
MNAPERLGKYPITGVLGKGAMGIVYKGFDPVIKRPIAVKTVRRDLLEDDERAEWMAARFRNEAQAAGRLAHPAIVGVYDYGEDDRYAYIAMEYVEGNSLREYFGRGTRFAEADAVSVMVQLLDALHYAHEQGVVHRAVKPSNLIITSAGKLKVADFGIARLESTNLTQTGAVMGTPGYMAPEQYLGETIDRRVDIFAAGVVFYQLLTGRAPFAATSDAVMMHKVCNEDAAPVSQVEGNARWAVYDPIVARALAKSADRRYPMAALFKSALVAAHEGPVSAAVSDETIIGEVIRAPGLDPGAASRSRGTPVLGGTPPRRVGTGTAPTPTPASAPPPTGWDAAVLSGIERELARFVGPLARVMVRRAAQQAGDVPTLRQLLAAELRSDVERTAFLREGTPPPGRGGRPATASPSTSLPRTPPTGMGRSTPVTPELIEQSTRVLLSFIGPIAKIVVRRAATQAPDREQLFLALAEHVTQPAERARFLTALAQLP